MHIRKLTIAIAALGLVVLPVSSAMAQNGGDHGGGHQGGDHQGGGHQGGGGHDGGGGHGGGYGGGGYGHGGGGYGHGDGGYGHGGGGYGGAGFALGAILGYYGGHPYYCRHHRHWRWSNRLQTYVYYDRGGYC